MKVFLSVEDIPSFIPSMNNSVTFIHIPYKQGFWGHAIPKMFSYFNPRIYIRQQWRDLDRFRLSCCSIAYGKNKSMP